MEDPLVKAVIFPSRIGSAAFDMLDQQSPLGGRDRVTLTRPAPSVAFGGD